MRFCRLYFPLKIARNRRDCRVRFSGANVNSVLAFAGASGTVSVDYAYTAAPVSVPEPGSGGLLASALVLLAGLAVRSGTLGRRND